MYKKNKRSITMIRLSTSELRKDTADALNKVAYGGDRIALQRRGKDVAVIVSVEDYELLRALEDRADMETIRKIKAESGEEVLWDDLKKELGL
jgi:prevent-host-death family protein